MTFVDLSVPEGLSLSCIRRTHDGWSASVNDHPWLDVHVTRVAGTPQEALDAAVAVALPLAEMAAAKRAEYWASAAARAAAAPDPSVRRAPARAPATRAGSAAPLVTGWTGSVPRAAAEWHVEGGRVRVRLRDGLVYADDGSTEREFPTVRRAKDETRAAIGLAEYRDAAGQGTLL